MISLNDILLAMSNIPVDDPIAEIWGRGLQGGYKIIEYTGTLPIAINANGEALIDYRIYGASGSVGEPTENLFNIDRERSDDVTFDTSKYIYGARVDSNTTKTIDIQSFTFNENNFTVLSTGGAGIGFIVKVKPSTTYSLSYQCNVDVSVNRSSAALNTAKANGTLGTYWDIYGDGRGSTFETLSDTEYVFIVFRVINKSTTYSHIMLVEGSTAPASYIPYGYKLPMVSRTKNLYNKNDPDIVYSAYMNYAGTIIKGNYGDTVKVSGYIPINGGQTYTGTNLMDSGYGNYYAYYDINKQLVNTGVVADNMVFNSPTNAAYIRTTLIHRNSEDIAMLTEGSTAPTSYIPYSCADVPVYIGENQLDSVEGIADYVDKASGKIVRMIGEYTFTGDETFAIYNNYGVCYTTRNISPQAETPSGKITMRCDHSTFTATDNRFLGEWTSASSENDVCDFRAGSSQVVFRSTANFMTAEECQSYFKNQYDNGTPVKISYWLKTPVEEEPPVPFPDIPTIKGETVIDYDGEPKPSQMYVKYKGKG